MNERKVLAELNRLGALIINRKWSALERRLSGWLRERENLKEDILDFIHEMRQEWDLTRSSWPVAVEPDINPTDELDELREYFSKAVDPALNNANFAAWGCIQLLADEEDGLDAFADIWVLLYRDANELKIGYYEIESPD